MEASFHRAEEATVTHAYGREAGLSYIRLQTLAGAHLQQRLQVLPLLVGTTCGPTHELNTVITLILSIFMAPHWGTQLLLFQFPVCQVMVWRPQKKTLDSIIYCCSYSCIICAVRLSSFLKAGSVSLVRKATGTAAMTNDPCTVIKTFHSNANLATITQTVMSPLFLSYF